MISVTLINPLLQFGKRSYTLLAEHDTLPPLRVDVIFPEAMDNSELDAACLGIADRLYADMQTEGV